MLRLNFYKLNTKKKEKEMSIIPSPLSFSSVRFIEQDKSQYVSTSSAINFGALLKRALLKVVWQRNIRL